MSVAESGSMDNIHTTVIKLIGLMECCRSSDDDFLELPCAHGSSFLFDWYLRKEKKIF